MSTTNTLHNRAVWFDIPVRELDRAIEFYAPVLNIEVKPESFGDVEFAVFEHGEGNGGCLVVDPGQISPGGVLIYLNVDGRIRDAVTKCNEHGGTVERDVHEIGAHGFRAIVRDPAGNKVALHSNTDA